MLIIKTIIIREKEKEIKIYFGVAETEDEHRKIYQLRHEIYIKKRGYIGGEPDKDHDHGEGLEYDSYDKSGRCVSFLAMAEDEVIGTVRTISAPLPIKKNYYSFLEPKEAQCDESQKIELGRLISTGRCGEYRLPRHLIILGLFDAVTVDSKSRGIKLGYGAIKVKALNKIEKLSIPIKKITEYKLIFDENNEDPLNNFFTNQEDPVAPIYFMRERIEKYFKDFFGNGLVFKKVGKDVYVYRGNFFFVLFLFLKKISL